MSRARARNVEHDPAAPVAAWPFEAIRAAVERGNLRDYRALARAIAAEPWGDAARRIEQVLEWTDAYGAGPLLHRVIERTRDDQRARERTWVREQLLTALRDSQLSRAQFAQQLGTSTSRLSTYLTGSTVPAATLLARAQHVAQHAQRLRG